MRCTLWIAAMVALGGCELIVDFDRSQITEDAGADAASETEDAAADEDAGASEDAAVDAPRVADMDAGVDAAMACTESAMCDDEVPCTVDACDGSRCVHSPDDAMCSDDDDCTSDLCDPVMGCQSEPLCGVLAEATLPLKSAVSLRMVQAVESGFVVIQSDAAGSPDVVLGAAAVSASAAGDVTVELSRPVIDGETLHATLYVDLGVAGTFEPAVDEPETLGGEAVTTSFVASVPATTPDVEVPIGNEGSLHYVFMEARPSSVAFATGNDPALTLVRGTRYRFANMASSGHPFELITIGPSDNGSDDTVQASQRLERDGPLEADEDVAWVEEEDGAIVFTVDADFEAAVDGYRCSFHIGSMRGSIAFADP